MARSIWIGIFGILLLITQESSAVRPDHHIYLSTAANSIRPCLKCHKKSRPTHTTGRYSTIKGRFPLSSSGKVVCITCHDCIRDRCVLRESSPKLCMACHDCERGMSCMIGYAHYRSTQKAKAADVVSYCMGCHDGTIGGSECPYARGMTDFFTIKPRRTDIEDKFRVRDRRIVLIDGRVTCISCHNIYTGEHSKLSISSVGGVLCQSCHNPFAHREIGQLITTISSVHCISCHSGGQRPHGFSH